MTIDCIEINKNSILYNGKSEDVIPTLEDNSIDLVITSPPYNVDLGNNKYYKNAYNLYNDNKDHWDYIDWLKDIFKNLWPKLKKGGRVCLSGDTLVSTKNGFIPIKDISVGDKVLTHNGVWKNVTETMKRKYNSKILNIQAENNNDINITPNHPVYSVGTEYCPYRKDISYICRDNCPQENDVWRKGRGSECKQLYYKKYKKEFIPAGKLKVKDFVCMPVPKYFKNKKSISNDLTYLIGLYLSEGWIKDNPRAKSIHFASHINEVEISNKIKECALAKFNKNSGKDYLRGNCRTVNLYSTKMGRYFEKFGRGAKNKNIPWDIIENSKIEDLLNIIIAHWIGDGSIIRDKKIKNHLLIDICTVSPILSMQIRDILIINGFSPKVSHLKSKNSFHIILAGKDAHLFYKKTKEIYKIDMYGYDNKNENDNFKEKSYRKVDEDYIFYKIKKIKQNPYNDYVYNIEVEDDESYCLTNLSVHNCINIGDGKNGTVPTHVDIIHFMTRELRYILMANIIWNKSQHGNRFAWGSFCSPSFPSFPNPFEYIMVFAKEEKKLQKKGETDLTNKEFIDWSLGMWNIAPETKMNKIGHPAMFPVNLPYRLIKMLSWKDATVLDIFNGAGTTGFACELLQRKYIGIELSKTYCDLTVHRIKNVRPITERDMFAI